MKKLFFLLAFVWAFSLNATAQTSGSNEITTVIYEGKTFQKGDRVKVISYAGTVKPNETGYINEVLMENGRTGTVICGKKREATSYFTPKPNEPIQIVLVQWDTQDWNENGQNGKKVRLKSFQSTIHVSYLDVIN